MARQRARRVRRWLLVVAAVTLVSGIPATLDLVNTARAAVLERQIAPVLARLTTTQNGLQNALTRHKDLSTWIAQADALRTKRSWTGLFLAVTQRMPDEVWLIATETIDPVAEPSRRKSSASRGPTTGAEPEEPLTVMLDGPAGIRITGYALDHDWLYEFMSRLNSARLFTYVELVQAGKEPVLEGQAVRFVLECAW